MGAVAAGFVAEAYEAIKEELDEEEEEIGAPREKGYGWLPFNIGDVFDAAEENIGNALTFEQQREQEGGMLNACAPEFKEFKLSIASVESFLFFFVVGKNLIFK